MEPAIIHEDARVIAVCKPAGQPVIAARGQTREPLNAEVARRTGGRIFVVHRIDCDASGLVVFAKDADTHRRLCAEFEARQARKVYLAAVLGRIEGSGTIDLPLRAFGSGRMGAAASGGKASKTLYSVAESFPAATLLKVEPESGRRHQIRVHLYNIGHPVLGDRLYGSPRPVGGAKRLMLHALELSIPSLGPSALRAEPDAGFLEILQELRHPGPSARHRVSGEMSAGML